MKQLALLSIHDVYGDNLSDVWDYERNRFSNKDLVEAVLLLPNTTRTNVMLRDSSGRFISYKEVIPEVVGDAVASLRPFPTH
jgi:hypothetical protein